MTEDLSAARLEFPDTEVQVYAGEHSLSLLPALLEHLNLQRPFLVCGRHVGRLAPVIDLQDSGLLVGAYGEVESDPSDTTVARAGEQVRRAGADSLIAIGGGSSLDAAKAIAAEAAVPGWIGACDRPGQPTQVPPGVLPVIAVPTTAGTGSEVTPFSVITFAATERKLVLNNPALLPRAALLDPALLPSAPREVRVAAGMDALTHAAESYLSKQATAETRARSLEAVVAIAAHLPGAVAEPPAAADLAAMQKAALLAGLAFSRARLGVVHALALPLSALFGVPHGVANAILLPHGLAHNLPAAGHLMRNLSEALLVKSPGKEVQVSPEQVVEAVTELARRIGAPSRMREVGVDRTALQRMARQAAQSAHLAVNPRSVEPEDLIAIYEAAW